MAGHNVATPQQGHPSV